MPVKGVKQGPIVIEKDAVTIRGVELKGQWNRMFESRVIDDYDVTHLDEVAALEGGESIDYCYQCGKCVPVCPVDVVGNYGPRKIYRKLQLGVNLVEDPDLWLCTTCMNCLRVCPKEVNMIKIMPAVREVAVNQSQVPAELQKAFENTARYGNPLGENPRKRAEWGKEEGVPVPIMAQVKRPVDVLWYVSTYTSYHPRGKDAARAMARVLTALGVDWGILGPEEKDDGDSQRLAGEKGLFEMLAEQNIATFNKYSFNKMVVSGPHEYNAFKNIYPNYGGEYAIEHYTQFLRPMLPRLRELMHKPLNVKVTFHDPCYLGRHNGEYDAPRELLRAIPGVELIEMGRCRENGYCCGGGGGGMWTDSFSRDYTKMRLSDRRVIEAVETGADVLAVCCPFEVSRFEDAVKATGNAGKLVVRDIIEMIDESMRGVGEGKVPMNISVLVRQIPDLVEELEVNDEGTGLNRDFLKYVVNEWDDWALEQALLLKEAHGGSVTVIGLDLPETDNTLFTALAKGADAAHKIEGDFSEGVSSHQAARLFAEALKGMSYDLILTGVQSAEDLDGQIPVLLASYLGLPHVSVVTGVEVSNGKAVVHKEYSGGRLAEFEVNLPAVLGIQTAKQAPRYAPVSRVRAMMKEKKIEPLALQDGTGGSGIKVRRLFKPESGSHAEMIEGDAESIAERVVGILKDKGLVK